MANVLTIAHASIKKNGGPITEDRYIGDGTNAVKAGQLCKISAGTVVPMLTNAGAPVAGELDTDQLDAAYKLVIPLSDYAINSDNMAVQEITADTVLEGYVVDSSASDVTMDVTDIGTRIAGYQDANGRLSFNNTTTKGCFYVLDVDDVYDPYQNAGDFEEDSGGTRHSRIQVKVNPSLVL